MDLDDDQANRPQAGPCTRKEYRRQTASEIQAFHNALRAMKNSGEYGVFVRQHRPANSPGAHFGPCFACWHREYLILYVIFSHHNLNGSSDSVNGDLQFLWG